MKINGVKWIFLSLSILCFSLMATVPGFADSLTVNHVFETSGQSMWGPGSATILDFEKFYGVSWNKSGGVDALGCGWFGDCYGAEFNAYTSGRIGVDVGFELNSGSVDASIPTKIDLGFPGTVNPYGGSNTFTVDALAGYGSGLLTATSPGVSAYADLVFEILAGATGEICFISCGTFGGNIVNVNTGAELLAFNRDNDGELRVLGINAGIPVTGSIGSYVNYEVNIPNTDASGSGYPPILTNATSNFVDVDANIVNVATSALGIPPLSGSVGPIEYNLLSAGLGLDMGVYQDLSLMPNVHIRLDVAETGQSVFFDPGTPSPGIHIPYNYDRLHITPTFFMDGLFSNDSGFDLTPYLWASGGEFGMSGIGSVGPLFSTTYDLGTFPVSLYDTSFTMAGFNSLTGPVFEIEIVPEPGSLLLMGSGLFIFAFVVLRKRTNRKGCKWL